MNRFDEDYYRYKIFNGIPFDVQVCPARNYGKRAKESTNIYSGDAEVCLSCTKSTCTGSKNCCEKRRSELLAEQRKKKKAEASAKSRGKEVMD